MRHGRINSTLVAPAVGVALTIALSACAPSATYPPVETTAKLTKPTFEPMPTVMAAAIKFTRENYTKDLDLPINLPAGMPPQAYDKVFAKLGDGRPMTTAGEPAIHITEVRTRTFNAQVDLIYPRRDGFNQFITLTMKRSVLENYRVDRVRPWQLRDVTAMTPNYVAPPPPPEEADTEADSEEHASADGAEESWIGEGELDSSAIAASPTDQAPQQK
jgi:hypothetical protein